MFLKPRSRRRAGPPSRRSRTRPKTRMCLTPRRGVRRSQPSPRPRPRPRRWTSWNAAKFAQVYSSRFGVWQNFSKFGLCLKTTQSVLNSFENFFENYSFIILCSCIDICNCLDFLFYASGSITEHVRGYRYVADNFY